MTRYDPLRHHRRSIRLKGYDYASAGAYFVTVCTQRRMCVLDDPVVAGIILDVWEALPRWFPTIALDEFVVMPNHVHLMVWLQSPDSGAAGVGARARARARAGASPAPTVNDAADVGATLAVALETVAPEWAIPEPETVNARPALGDVIGAFKSLVFTMYLDWVQAHDPSRRAKFWQRNYYEHIVRNERELRAIRQYIANNPLKWALDMDNPANFPKRPLPETVDDYLRDAGVDP